MATIADLHKSISLMSDEEAISLVVQRRESRRIPKKKQGKKGSSNRKSKINVDELFAGFNSKQQEEMIKKMERMAKK